MCNISVFSRTPCEAIGCPKVTNRQLGHGFCAAHCACLHQTESYYVYDPFRCGPCVGFFEDSFQGNSDAGSIKDYMAEVEGHVVKLRRYLKKLDEKPHLKLSGFVTDLRSKVKKLDLDVFRDLVVRDCLTVDHDRDSLVSVPPSMASETSKGQSKGSGRPSPSDKTVTEEMVAMKGQIDRLESAMLKLLDCPALKVANPPQGRSSAQDQDPRSERSKDSTDSRGESSPERTPPKRVREPSESRDSFPESTRPRHGTPLPRSHRRERGERTESSQQRERGKRSEKAHRTKRSERSERGERSEQGEQSE